MLGDVGRSRMSRISRTPVARNSPPAWFHSWPSRTTGRPNPGRKTFPVLRLFSLGPLRCACPCVCASVCQQVCLSLCLSFSLSVMAAVGPAARPPSQAHGGRAFEAAVCSIRLRGNIGHLRHHRPIAATAAFAFRFLRYTHTR